MAVDLREMWDDLQASRVRQREFLVVVLLVGLGLNLLASMIWDLTSGLGSMARALIAVGVFLVCAAAGAVLVYYRRPLRRYGRYPAFYEFVPVSGGGCQIVLRNSLSCGPVLERIGKFTNWWMFDKTKRAENVPPPNFVSLSALLSLEVLLDEFPSEWSHVPGHTRELLVLEAPDGTAKRQQRQEVSGGQLLDIRGLWPVAARHIDPGLLSGSVPHQSYDISFTLKLPPATELETRPRTLRLKNRFAQVTLVGGESIIGMRRTGLPDRVRMGFLCDVRFPLLCMFSRRFGEYFIWSGRFFSACEDYFTTDRIEDLIRVDGLPAPLFVGSLSKRVAYPNEERFTVDIEDIELEDREFFHCCEDAVTAGYECTADVEPSLLERTQPN